MKDKIYSLLIVGLFLVCSYQFTQIKEAQEKIEEINTRLASTELDIYFMSGAIALNQSYNDDIQTMIASHIDEKLESVAGIFEQTTKKIQEIIVNHNELLKRFNLLVKDLY